MTMDDVLRRLRELHANASLESARGVDSGDDVQAAAVHSWSLMRDALAEALELAAAIPDPAPVEEILDPTPVTEIES